MAKVSYGRSKAAKRADSESYLTVLPTPELSYETESADQAYLRQAPSGPLRVISDLLDVRRCFSRLAAADPQQAQWSQDLSEAMYQRLAAAVRWFSIEVEHCDAKAKLSQNHQPARQARVIARLAVSTDSSAQATGAAMARTLVGQTPWPAEDGP
jgi:hypothetical protein